MLLLIGINENKMKKNLFIDIERVNTNTKCQFLNVSLHIKVPFFFW